MKRITLKNGVKIYNFSSFGELIDYAVQEKKILVALNAEKITHATAHTKALCEHNIAYSDGVGAVMALRKKGYDAMKIPGCELWLEIIRRLMPEGKTFYLIGGTTDVINATVSKLTHQFPGINIVNHRNGYIKNDQERQSLLDDIAAKKPDVVFVAMGSPLQEILMGEMQTRHQAIYQGLGGSFDVYTGHAKRAPKWWIDHNIEFLYRLIQEPSRFKRQLFLFKFIYMLSMGKL
ncbi:MAG: WecB/TagA/CpsF family glycosyltransferase [Paludibacteraceae bacterium]|nr:WecB/TagA/CpsF family glycosyltransferase [Paludibacteraceae bacterium]